mmetsp:Transcript_23052/g.71833  ORF Transcript_23052/g.71833 Transcript_23052/m.71833 type:complete len:239 (-) Transcript_23052:243-959(-)
MHRVSIRRWRGTLRGGQGHVGVPRKGSVGHPCGARRAAPGGYIKVPGAESRDASQEERHVRAYSGRYHVGLQGGWRNAEPRSDGGSRRHARGERRIHQNSGHDLLPDGVRDLRPCPRVSPEQPSRAVSFGRPGGVQRADEQGGAGGGGGSSRPAGRRIPRGPLGREGGARRQNLAARCRSRRSAGEGGSGGRGRGRAKNTSGRDLFRGLLGCSMRVQGCGRTRAALPTPRCGRGAGGN